jgi:hypothetical protein
MMDGPFAGGCTCCAIRFEIDRIFDVIYCRRNQCRRSSGAPVLVWAQVASDAFRLFDHRNSASSLVRLA